MRKIIAYKGYYSDFMSRLSDQERKKIRHALLLLETEDKVPSHYIKFIRDGIYEFRVNYGNNEFRLLFTYDGDTIVYCSTVSGKRRRKPQTAKSKKHLN